LREYLLSFPNYQYTLIMRITLLHLIYTLLAVGTLIGTTSCGSTIYGASLDLQRAKDKASVITQPRYKAPPYQQPTYQGGYQGQQQPAYQGQQGGYQGQQPTNQGQAPTGSQQNGSWN
jgi:hypothetical protein